jgi:hypothetical protein
MLNFKRLMRFFSQSCAPQTGVRGYQKVEEYDPMERMKRLATGPAVSSLEEELKTMQVGCMSRRLPAEIVFYIQIACCV